LEDQKRFLEQKEQRAKLRQEKQLATEQSQVIQGAGINQKSRKILEEK
jgi:hypothetical protein